MGDLIAFIAEIILDIQEFLFQRKKKKQRMFEKENNLPREKMISPYQRLYILLGVLLVIFIIISFIFSIDKAKRTTVEKIIQIKELLENEKKVFGSYPKQLETIKRGSPLLQELLIDGWGNTFNYKTTENSYILISSGKDGEFQTQDDLK